MRALLIINALFATVLVLLGLPLLFLLGITGGIFLVTGLVFAGISAWLEAPTRAAVGIALVMDAAIALVAANKLAALWTPAVAVPGAASAGIVIATSWLDVVWPVGVIVLMLIVIASVLRDWRALRTAPWL